MMMPPPRRPPALCRQSPSPPCSRTCPPQVSACTPPPPRCASLLLRPGAHSSPTVGAQPCTRALTCRPPRALPAAAHRQSLRSCPSSRRSTPASTWARCGVVLGVQPPRRRPLSMHAVAAQACHAPRPLTCTQAQHAVSRPPALRCSQGFPDAEGPDSMRIVAGSSLTEFHNQVMGRLKHGALFKCRAAHLCRACLQVQRGAC